MSALREAYLLYPVKRFDIKGNFVHRKEKM